MTTTIIANGSKWAGEPPGTLNILLETMAESPLDPRWEGVGNRTAYAEDHNGRTTFHGNFALVSHVFQIETDEAAVVDALKAAIAANMSTPEYQRLRREWGSFRK